MPVEAAWIVFVLSIIISFIYVSNAHDDVKNENRRYRDSSRRYCSSCYKTEMDKYPEAKAGKLAVFLLRYAFTATVFIVLYAICIILLGN